MERIIRLIHEVPLIDPTSSEAGILPTLSGAAKGGALYFGTGLTTAKAISVGVPFDVLGMLLVADKIRRELGLSMVIQLVADTHAKSNLFTNPDEVDAMAELMKNVSARVASLIGLSGAYTLLKSSDFDQKSDYREILGGVISDDHEYVRREWSDIEYLRRAYGLVIKLSWVIDPKAKRVGFDERLYDLRFRDVIGQSMSFVYVNPGRTLDPNRIKASPYISIAGENRILLCPNEDVRKKFAEAERNFGTDKLNGTRQHLSHVVAMYEKQVEAVAGADTPLEDKIQLIINRIFV